MGDDTLHRRHRAR